MVFCFLVILYLTSFKVAAGQGFRPSDATPVGASGAAGRLQQQYRDSQAWKRSYKLSPKSACSISSTANLCGAAAANTADAYPELTLAMSPLVYSSQEGKCTSGVQLVNPPGDQQACETCSAFAVASAAETAMASVLNVSAADCSISVQALYFCPTGQPARTCNAGWDLQGALAELQQRGQNLPTTVCQPYKPDFQGLYSRNVLCDVVCSISDSTSRYASLGQFSATQIVTMWEAQRHIRQFGSVVTRFDVYSDLRLFFSSGQTVKAVYTPGPGATFEFAHAVALVGYDNVNNFWLVKNSWGAHWADNGYFRVSYGVCSVLTPGAEGAWGVLWTLAETPSSSKLRVKPAPRSNCYWYTAQPGDYLSKVAWKAGIPLDRFMLDNTDRVKDLDASLGGLQLLLCNPSAGTTLQVNFKGSGPDIQLEALLRIKAAIDKTGVLRGWNKDSGQGAGYCFWKGVWCYDDNKSVGGIELTSYMGVTGLKGTLPAATAFAGLARLDTIIISHQQNITGTIPDWSNLKRMYGIQLESNGLTGTIPASLGKLQLLEAMILGFNKLRGTIPEDFQSLTLLKYWNIAGNMLTGTLPVWIGALSKLEWLALGKNNFHGDVPQSLGNIRSLKMLWLSGNPHLGGCLPEVLHKQLNLDVAGGHVSEFNNLLLYTQISGFCSASGGAASHLSVNTSDPQLESLLRLRAAVDPADRILSHHGWFREAGTDGGYCVWAGVDCKDNTSAVWRINISPWPNTDIKGLQGTLPSAEALRGLTNLTSIVIGSQPGLHGTLPDNWSTIRELEVIDVSNTSVSGTIPSLYGNLERLSEVSAWGCKLRGKLPPSFAHLSGLRILDVSWNALTGGVPVWLGELKSLRELSLQANQFGGSIPESLSRLSSMQLLNLGGNGLTGSIPVSFTDLVELKSLYLSNNTLTGTLPDSLNRLTQLETFAIRNNTLSGTIPASYSKMTSLSTFYASGNRLLHGCLPLSWKHQLTKVNVKTAVIANTQLRGYC